MTYQPVPLNWMAGADSNLWTGALHDVHRSIGESENFWITSNRWPQAPHSYSYSGMALISVYNTDGQAVAAASSRRV